MKKKLWLKHDPVVTAEIIHQLNGHTVAVVDNPRLEGSDAPSQYLGFINLEDWSPVEVVPLPLCTAEKLWVAVVGEVDPADVTYVTFDNEVALHVAIQTREDILGYFEVETPTAMIPVKLST